MTPRPLLYFAVLTAFGATVALAQDSSSTPATIAVTSDQPAKKVWTNDDLTSSSGSANISSSPARSNLRPVKTGQQPATAKGRDAKWYHDQIAKLQAQVPPLDSQIADLQAALDGKPTGDGKTSQRPRGVKADDWSVELTQLREKRVDLLSKIDALQDQARRNGIPDGALP
jgi:hypothetical protein